MLSYELQARLVQTVPATPAAWPVSPSATLLVLAIVIGLLERGSSFTLMRGVLSPFLLLSDSPAVGKAASLLTAAAASMLSTRPVWEGVRSFCVLAAIGALVLSAVDTGTHAGETATERDAAAGSALWWSTVGVLGACAFAALGVHAAPFFRHAVAAAALSMMMVLVAQSAQALFALSAALGALGALGLLRRRRRPPPPAAAAAATVAAAPSEGWLALGVLGALAAALTFEMQHPAARGAALAALSAPLLALGYGCARAARARPRQEGAREEGAREEEAPFALIELPSYAGAAGLLASAACQQWPLPTLLGLNVALRLAALFATLTLLLGGWGVRAALRPPARVRQPLVDVLVAATLLLLLAAVVVGNSSSPKEWRALVDWHTSGLLNLPKLVDGARYENRWQLLPWMAPLVGYSLSLVCCWPAQERRTNSRAVLCGGVVLALLVHGLSALSWSSLLLALALAATLLPMLEQRLRTRAGL